MRVERAAVGDGEMLDGVDDVNDEEGAMLISTATGRTGPACGRRG